MKNTTNNIWATQYITSDDVVAYGTKLTSKEKTDYVDRAITYASQRVNAVTGNKVMRLYNNDLSTITDTRTRDAIKYATWIYVNHLLNQGLDISLGSQSFNIGAISASITNPQSPDYIPRQVLEVLQSVGLYSNVVSEKGSSVDGGCDDYSGKWLDPYTQNYWIDWDAANRTFIRKEKLVSPDGSITIVQNSLTGNTEIESKGGSGGGNYTSPDGSLKIDNTARTIIIAEDIELQLETIGTVSKLTTQAKDNLVNAVNEVNAKAIQNAVDIGTLQGDVRTNTTDITALETKVGTATLTTLAKDLSAAVNELNAKAPSGDIYPALKTDLIAGTNITLTPNDGNKTITIAATGGSGGKTYTGGNGIDVDNTANTIALNQDTTDALAQIGTDKGRIDDLITHVGDVSSLNTQAKVVVDAINEVNTNVGPLTSLTTSDKTNIVDAINEVNTKSSTGELRFADISASPGEPTLAGTEMYNVIAGNNNGGRFQISNGGDIYVVAPDTTTFWIKPTSDDSSNINVYGGTTTLKNMKLTGLITPVADSDAASKAYVDGKVVPGGDIYPSLKTDLVAGTNITITPNDSAKTLTINATGGGSTGKVEFDDRVTPNPETLIRRTDNSNKSGIVLGQSGEIYLQSLDAQNVYVSLTTEEQIDYGFGTDSFKVNGKPITGVKDPTNPQDAATKAYVDASPAGNIYPSLKTDLVAGTNVTLTPNDGNSTITISATGGSGGNIGTAVFTNGTDNVNVRQTGSAASTGLTMYTDGGIVLSAATSSGGIIISPTNDKSKNITVSNTSGVVLTGLGLTGLPTPTNNADAANKAYVDSKVVPGGDIYPQVKAIVQGNPIIAVTADDVAKTLTLSAPQVTTNANNIGTMTNLTTTNKTTLVNAINEINAKPSGGGKDWVQVRTQADYTYDSNTKQWNINTPLGDGSYKLVILEGSPYNTTYVSLLEVVSGFGGNYFIRSLSLGQLNQTYSLTQAMLEGLDSSGTTYDTSGITFKLYQWQ